MSPPGWHVTMRLMDDRVIAPSVGERRMVARVLYEQGRARQLLAFRLADTHLHALLACPRLEAGQFARYVQTSLRLRLGIQASFNPSRVRPVADQSHLYNAFRYVLRQEAHHGTSCDLAHDGSSLLELLGLRTLCASTPDLVGEKLPRLRREELMELLRVDLDSAPAPTFSLLPDAAAAALALPNLSGCDLATTGARRAAVHVARALGQQTRDIASWLELSPRAVQRLSAEPIERAQARAVFLQLRLRSILGAAG